MRASPARPRRRLDFGRAFRFNSSMPELYIKCGFLRVRLNEGLARRDIGAHEDVEGAIRVGGVFDGDEFQDATGRVHRRLPQFFRIHLAQALIALDGDLNGSLSFARRSLGGGGFLRIIRFGRLKLRVFPRDAYLLLLGVCIKYFLALLDLVERRLRDEKEPAIDDRTEVAIEQSKKERADVSAVDVCIGRDDDLVIPQLRNIENIADGSSHRDDQIPDLFRNEHFVEAGAFDVEDLAAQGENRLRAAIASHFPAIMDKNPACKRKIMRAGHLKIVDVHFLFYSPHRNNSMVVVCNSLIEAGHVAAKKAI